MAPLRYENDAPAGEYAALKAALQDNSTETAVSLTLPLPVQAASERWLCEIGVDEKARAGNTGTSYCAKRKVRCPKCGFLAANGGRLVSHFNQCIKARSPAERCPPLPDRPLSPPSRACRW